MKDNPYSALVGVIRKEGAFRNFTPLVLGKVIKPLPNIEIVAAGMPLYKSDLLIDKWLLDRERITFECSNSHSCDDDSGHNHSIGVSNLKNVLSKGDTVLLARFEGEEKWLILSKVVSL